MMKLAVYFTIIAVMAFEVSSEDITADTSAYNLTSTTPRDIKLPFGPDAHLARLPKTRIIGGREISQCDRRTYKHQVGLHLDEGYWCGGSIVSSRVIITAAHCVEDMHRAIVFIGLYDKSKISPDNTQIVKITRNDWRQHPLYNNKTLQNDIAIINLPRPIKFNDNVGPIAIECDNNNRHENEVVRISGWGKHSDSDYDEATILRAADVATAPESRCKSVFGVGITPSMLCVDAKNSIGTCEGDSGGPVVSTKNGKLLGCTSFGAEGCQQPQPRVFTRVSAYAKWIHDNSVDHLC